MAEEARREAARSWWRRSSTIPRVSLEMLIIAAVRLAGSLPVLRWPFWGGLLALAVDQSDLFIMNLVELGGVEDYQSFDKYLDQAYLLAFLIVSRRWPAPERWVAAGLYAYRFVGFVAFEASGRRGLLLLFPNFFEPYFLLIAADRQFGIRQRLSAVASAGVLVCLAALKLMQEYVVHQARLLDGFTAVEAVEAVWRWLTGPLR